MLGHIYPILSGLVIFKECFNSLELSAFAQTPKYTKLEQENGDECRRNSSGYHVIH